MVCMQVTKLMESKNSGDQVITGRNGRETNSVETKLPKSVVIKNGRSVDRQYWSC